MIKDFIENRVIIKHWTHFGFVVSRILELGRQGWKDIILETVNEHKTFEHVIQTFEAWGCDHALPVPVARAPVVELVGSAKTTSHEPVIKVGSFPVPEL